MEPKSSGLLGNDNGVGKRRRKRGSEAVTGARFFLPKQGSTPGNPELGQEMPSEGEALIQALKSDQHFYALTVWKAVPQQNGGDPVITKEPVTDKTTQ